MKRKNQLHPPEPTPPEYPIYVENPGYVGDMFARITEDYVHISDLGVEGNETVTLPNHPWTIDFLRRIADKMEGKG